jgi:glycerophosphoryl diester phosphodiesterase
VVLISCHASHLDAVEIIAHRGASHDAPENTIAAFKLGWRQSADAGELDIHLSKDGQIVVIHDSDTKRTTGVSGDVARRTLDELRTLDAGSWKGEPWKGEKLPTLSEALETIPEGRRMFIEIKCGPQVLPILQRVLDASGKKPGQVAIIGFSHATMAKAKKRFPQLPVYWLASYEADKRTGRHPDIGTLIEKAKAAGLDGLNLDFKFPIDSEFVAQVKAAGLQLYVWTVDDAAVAARLAEAGVCGITTNRPGWLREQLK